MSVYEQRPAYHYHPNVPMQDYSHNLHVHPHNVPMGLEMADFSLLRHPGFPTAPRIAAFAERDELSAAHDLLNFGVQERKMQNDGRLRSGCWRLPSPTQSERSSSRTSSNLGEQQETTWPSPDPTVANSPGMAFANPAGILAVPEFAINQVELVYHNSIVAMNDIQQCADVSTEQYPEDDPHTSIYHFVQEGYEPIESVDSPEPEQTTMSVIQTVRTTSRSEQPVIKRRRNPTHRYAAVSRPSPAKVLKNGKRPSIAQRRCASDTAIHPHDATNGIRAFVCSLEPYGCPATFGSKNEWKRHVNTQHLRLAFWRCDQCPSQDLRPNDFNRKDLFIQHVRRMHPAGSSKTLKHDKNSRTKQGRNSAIDQSLNNIAQRCFKRLRSPPSESSCLFCDEKFAGDNSWDERMEHVGRHMESMKGEVFDASAAAVSNWRRDHPFEGYLCDEGLVEQIGNRLLLVDKRE